MYSKMMTETKKVKGLIHYWVNLTIDIKPKNIRIYYNDDLFVALSFERSLTDLEKEKVGKAIELKYDSNVSENTYIFRER